ncbi:hypothetical protein BH23ACT10_BH23ACT10_18720 [soil metagenome]
MSWGQDPQDRDRDFDPWSTERGRDVPADGPPGSPDRWGGDASPQRLQPLSLGDVIDGTFRLARAHWRAFAVGLGVIVVPLSLITGFVLAQIFGSTPGLLESLQNPDVADSIANDGNIDQFTNLVAGSGLAGIAAFLLSPLIYGIAVWIAARAYRTGSVDPMDGVRAAGRRYLPLLGASLLLGIVPLLFFVLPAAVLGVGAASGVDALLVVGGIGLLVAVVLVIIALARFTVTIPALMLEEVGPVRSLRRSNTLVKGRTGFVLGTMVVVYIISAIVQLVIAVPFQLLGGVFERVLGAAAGAITLTAGNIVSSILGNTLLGVAIVLIYFDRRVRAEGYDLSELADELGDPPDHAW